MWRNTHVMSYVVKCGPPERLFFFGAQPTSEADAYYLRVTLGIDAFVNLLPVTVTPRYMLYFDKPSETEELMKSVPALFQEAAFPQESLSEQSTTKQMEFYVTRARRIATYLKEHPRLTCYIHHKSGDREEALMTFLVWYLLDPATSPHETLSEWLTEKDYKQVLRDDDDIAFLQSAIQFAKKSGKNTTLTNWLSKKIKR